MSDPLVSISCITYNHAPFIRECLDGFLMQQTNFPFEILIHDDASTDGTKEIIEEYVDKYSDLIFPIYQTENQYTQGVRGMMARFNFPRAKGKYIALCEGDDYWTDPLKLQKQVNLMEEEDITLCHTGATNSLGKVISKNDKELDNIQRIIYGNYIITASSMIRKNVLAKYTWVNAKYPFGDWPLWLTASANGKVLFLPDITTVYRINETGVWQNNWKDRIGSDRMLAEIELLTEFKSNYREYIHEVDEAILVRLRKLVDFYFECESYGLILRNPMKRLIKDYPELQNIRSRARVKYLKTKIGL